MNIHQRLKLARERAGYKSAAAAAEALGAHYGTYSGHENGSRGVKAQEARRYASFFKVPQAWLLLGDGDIEGLAKKKAEKEAGQNPTKSVPVRGITKAGSWVEIEEFENDGFDGASVPTVPGEWEHLTQFAYKVSGSSMDADRIFDGDYVVCVGYFDARSDLRQGDCVVVERVRNSAIERSVKIVEIQGKDIHFCPRSTNPAFKPIVVKLRNRHMVEADDTDVRIVGLVIGVWCPR